MNNPTLIVSKKKNIYIKKMHSMFYKTIKLLFYFIFILNKKRYPKSSLETLNMPANLNKNCEPVFFPMFRMFCSDCNCMQIIN